MKTSQPNNSIIDFRILYLKYKRYWYVLAISFVIAFLSVWLYGLSQSIVYQSRASILIRDERIADDFFPEAELMWEQNINNKKFLLQSHSLVESTLNNIDSRVFIYRIDRRFGVNKYTDLYTSSPFRLKTDSLFSPHGTIMFQISILDESRFTIQSIKGSRIQLDDLQASFGQSLSKYGYNFSVEKNGHFFNNSSIQKIYKVVVREKEDLSYEYLNALQVEWKSVELKNTIAELKFATSNQSRAIDFLDQLITNFSRRAFADRNRAATTVLALLDDRLQHAMDTLKRLEFEIEQFKVVNRFPDHFLETRRLMNELSITEDAHSSEVAKNQYYKQVLAQIDEGSLIREFAGFSAHRMTDGYLNRLLSQYTELQLERSMVRETSTEQTLALRRVNNKILSVESDIRDYLVNVIAASDLMVRELAQRLSQINHRIVELPQIEKRLFELERSHELLNNQYKYLSERRMEAEITLLSTLPDHEIIDRAKRTNPIYPQRKQSFLLAFSLALVLPLSFILIRESFNTRIIAEEVSQVIDKPIVGLIPGEKTGFYKRLAKSTYSEQKPNLQVLNSFRGIRSNIFLLGPQRCKVIVISSVRQGEGKTHTAVHLAKALAMSAYKVVYINADLHKQGSANEPELHALGLSDYLFGEASLSDILMPADMFKNYFSISNGSDTHMTTELLESAAMDELISELQHFDFIVIDTSPIGLTPDAQPLLIKADLALFVVRHRYSRHSDLVFINKFCKEAKLKNVAISINDVKSKKSNYGYYYSKNYNQG